MRVALRYSVMALALALSAPTGARAEAAPDAAFFSALRQADLRVASIGYRLVTANAALCRSLQPELGMPLHALDQYSPAARAAADAAFHFESAVEIEDVVPGGPAARAGLMAGDSLIALDGKPLPAKAAVAGAAGSSANTRIAVENALAALPPDRSVTLTVRRDGHDRTVTLRPLPGCRTGFEMMLGEGYDADSDGEKIRVGSRFLEDFDDNQVAVVMAHELSHTLLEHRRRLDAAGVSFGLLAEVGRNGRLWRQTEDDADRLSVYLLFNAGYDPMSPVRFWRGPGAKVGGGILRARTHLGPNTRAQSMAEEAAKIPAGAARPFIPPMLAERDAPLR